MNKGLFSRQRGIVKAAQSSIDTDQTHPQFLVVGVHRYPPSIGVDGGVRSPEALLRQAQIEQKRADRKKNQAVEQAEREKEMEARRKLLEEAEAEAASQPSTSEQSEESETESNDDSPWGTPE